VHLLLIGYNLIDSNYAHSLCFTVIDLFIEYQSGITCSFSTIHCSANCPVGFTSDDYGCPISCVCALSGNFEVDVAFNPTTLSALLAVSLLEGS